MDVQMCKVVCWACGTPFALAETLHQNAAARREVIYCPRGCKLLPGAPSELEKARAELETMTRLRDIQRQRAESNYEEWQKVEKRFRGLRSYVKGMRRKRVR